MALSQGEVVALSFLYSKTFHFISSAKHSTLYVSSLKNLPQDLCHMSVRNGWCRGLLRLSWRGAVWQGAGGWGHDHPFPTLCRSSHPRELEGGSFKYDNVCKKTLQNKFKPLDLKHLCVKESHFSWPTGGTQLWLRSERGLVLQTQPSWQTWCRSWWRGSRGGKIFVCKMSVVGCPT